MELSKEQQEFEFDQMQRFMGGGSPNSAQIVETKSGQMGTIKSNDDLINGKVRVYTEAGNLLCEPSTLTLKGFID